MKKFTKLWQLMIVLMLTSSVVFAQKSYSLQDANKAKTKTVSPELQKEYEQQQVMEQAAAFDGQSFMATEVVKAKKIKNTKNALVTVDVDPKAGSPASQTDFLFDFQFDWSLVNPDNLSVGIETDGNFIYTCHWQNSTIYRYDMNGVFIETFDIGVALMRDMAYNPNNGYFYGSAASTTVWEMDFTQGAESLVNTFIAPAAIRGIGFDSDNNWLFGNNWSTDVVVFDLTGALQYSFVVNANSYYGFAYDNHTAGGPYIWGHAQMGTSLEWLVQMDAATGAETGLLYDVGAALGHPAGGNAGGLAITPPGTFPSVDPTEWSIFGITQNSFMWAIELDEPNPCSTPIALTATNIGNTSADLEWTESGTSTAWEVEWGVAGFVQGTGTIISPATSPESLTGLTTLTGYDFYVRSDCGGGSYSGWSAPYNFTTTGGDCQWECVGVDAYGDGWNGGSIDFVVDGGIVANWTGPATFGPESFYFPINDPSVIDIVWNPGSWDSEVTYEIYDNLGVLQFSDGPDPLGTTGLAGSCTVQTCPAPNTLTVTGITTTAADLGWTEAGTATAWEIEYGIAGFTLGTGTTINPATSPETVSGLTEGTSYDWYVKAICSPFDHSFWTGPNTFVTACVLAPPPGWIAEGEACGTDTNGGCNMAVPAYEPVPVAGGTILGTTWADAGMGGRDTDWYELVLPATSTVVLSASADELIIYGPIADANGVIINPDCATASSIAPNNTADACTETSLDLGSLEAGTYWFFVGMTVYDGFPCDVNYYITFDITEILCPDPTALGVNALTGTTADLTWVSTSGSSNVEYGLAGFTLGVDPIGTAAGTTSPYGISGLTAQTAYEFYVQDDCGGGDVSAWIGPFAFTTMCATVGVPFTESFDVQADPNCWSNTSSNPVANGLWEYGQQGNNPAGWGAAAVDDHTGNAGFFAFSDGSSPEVADIMLMTPLIDASSLMVPYLTFYVFSNNEDYPGDNVPLYVDFWDGAAWNTALTYAADAPDWVFVGVDLSGYSITGDIQFRFTTDQTAPINAAFYNDILIDDVSVDEMPTCIDPSVLGIANLTFESADLEWTSNTGLSNLEFGLAGFTIGVDPIVSVSGTTSAYPVSGLTEATDYEFYVQDDCGGGDLSNWAGPFAFTTPIATYMVSGTVDYNGTPMNYVTVNVMDGVTVVATDLTDNAGYFEFPMVPNGNFTYAATTTKVRGGTNVGDINLVIDHILGSPLVGLPFNVADVSADGFVTVTDLNEMLDDILGTPGYPAVPDYFFDDAPLVVAGGNVPQDLPSLCSGDPNGDYIVPVEAPPSNDLCSAAEAVVGPYPVTGIDGTTLYSTNDCPVLLDQNGEVWYAIDLPYANNVLVLSYCGDGLMNNGWIIGTTVMCSCDQADYLFADSWNFAAPCVNDLTWNNIAGPTTFYYPVSTGDFQEHFTLDVDVTEYIVIPPPANDDCASAEAIGVVTDQPYSTLSATASGVTPTCGGTTPIDIWYVYTATADGILDVDLCDSGYDTRLAIYDACGGVNTECNDDSCGLQSALTFNVTNGMSYYIQVSGYNAGAGDGNITVVYTP